MTVPSVSIVVPVLNGRRTLPAVLAAIDDQCRARPHEVIVVDDGSTDGSRAYLRKLSAAGCLRLLHGEGRGPAAAVNLGIRESSGPFVCQIDQDVILHPGWIETLMGAMARPDVAAAQGRYTTSPFAGFWARVMGRDLEQRYARIRSTSVDHVCTGNTLYRRSALHQVGLLDERFGYGADNDLSYRLGDAGYTLEFRPTATSTHVWRETVRAYLKQQYGVGYGRLDLIWKHPRRVTGDDVSGTPMILHAALMLLAMVALLAAAVAGIAGSGGSKVAVGAVGVMALLGAERLAAGLSCWRRTGDQIGLAFPIAHLLRDAAWAVAIVVWLARTIRGAGRSPSGSMPRGGRTVPAPWSRPGLPQERVLVLIPAHNEAASLARVLRDVRRTHPGLDVLVVDDGSTDATAEIAALDRARYVSLPIRTGVGGAVRTGIRYAVRHRYDYVVRMDGDGQHRACDLGRILAGVASGDADAAIGSRYLHRRAAGRRGWSRSMLSTTLSLLTGRRVTDPTSGFWAFGPRAMDLLMRHHPTGYPEPELLLFLHRNGLRVIETAIRVRPRIAGRTTLTWPRTAVALGRMALAMLIVPLRRAEQHGGAIE